MSGTTTEEVLDAGRNEDGSRHQGQRGGVIDRRDVAEPDQHGRRWHGWNDRRPASLRHARCARVLSAHARLLMPDRGMGRDVHRQLRDRDRREQKQEIGGKRPCTHIASLVILYPSLDSASTERRQRWASWCSRRTNNRPG